MSEPPTTDGTHPGQVRLVDTYVDEFVGTPDERRTITGRTVTVWTGYEWVDVRALIDHWYDR